MSDYIRVATIVVCAAYEIVVRLAPTSKSRSIIEFLYRVVNYLIPDRKN